MRGRRHQARKDQGEEERDDDGDEARFAHIIIKWYLLVCQICVHILIKVSMYINQLHIFYMHRLTDIWQNLVAGTRNENTAP